MKKVKLDLVGLNGNAFVLLGSFSAAAKNQGWSKDEISKVLTEARAGDYDHLVQTLAMRTEPEE